MTTSLRLPRPPTARCGSLLGCCRNSGCEFLRPLGSCRECIGGSLKLGRGRRHGFDDLADRAFEVVCKSLHVDLALHPRRALECRFRIRTSKRRDAAASQNQVSTRSRPAPAIFLLLRASLMTSGVPNRAITARRPACNRPSYVFSPRKAHSKIFEAIKARASVEWSGMWRQTSARAARIILTVSGLNWLIVVSPKTINRASGDEFQPDYRPIKKSLWAELFTRLLVNCAARAATGLALKSESRL